MSILNTDKLLSLLKQYFGFTSFRPLQQEIIADSLAGKDVFALLPTGGGKSLCFQLPALARPGLTVVVSPLIALMKDQVDALQSAGVAATFLNSSIDSREAHLRIQEIEAGRCRLLYVAPERLVLPGTIQSLQRWNVNLLAIDEAHCISEWGHDFRPEYRQLAQLRGQFPNVPVMALTATATVRVREDIVKHLDLRKPSCYVASFNRPNLTYRVLPKSEPYSQVLSFVRGRKNESGIIYCQSRKGAESVARRLNEDGISAAPYHAGMEADERSKNQELFLRDEVRVICATIAFGMGINKPNVRYVIHYDLPKNVESYYQETGRAGRDGLPSDCLLLFSAGDTVKQLHFIEEISDPHEQKIAREQLRKMVHYAECTGCRRIDLLGYFSEEWTQENCGACDNCLTPRPTYDGTIDAQKFLSCVYRIREKSGFGVGMKHIVEVLTGADTEKLRRWRHDELSTYGIGKDHTRNEWDSIGRELLRLGFLRMTTGEFSVLELTLEGKAVLTQRKPVTLTKPLTVEAATKKKDDSGTYDGALFDRLRTLRKRLADERDVPAYIVFSDVALRQMAREYPSNAGEFVRISGVGEKKLKEFSEPFLAEINAYLASNSRQTFTQAEPEPIQKSKSLNDTGRDTIKLFQAGYEIDEIAKKRSLKVNTIFDHLVAAAEAGEKIDLNRILSSTEQAQIAAAFAAHGFGTLKPIYDALGGKFEYNYLRLFRYIHNRDS